MKVTLCGAAGGIGQPLALLLKLHLPAGSTLALYDVVNIAGVAEDISHINTAVKVEPYLGDMKNPNTEAADKALHGADIVVIPAGVPRKPGMTRDDLFNINAGIVRDLINTIVKNCPKAFIAIITNPVNSTVPVAAEILKKGGVFNPKKLFGVSTLDIVRAQTFIGELKNVDPSKVQVDVVGGHSAETMLPVLSQVKGVSFTSEEEKALNQRIRDAGTAVVNAKAGAGSATLSMAFAALRFTQSLVRAFNGEKVHEIAYVSVEGSHDVGAEYFGLPIEIGKEGITKIFPLPTLSDSEQHQLKDMLPELKKNIEKGVSFGSAKL
jgi:NAD-dependent malate dehydrogenase